MPIARDADKTRARILRAARTEFMRHGYSGARIERISKGGRSSDRMIYYYFGSKDALYTLVLEGVYTELGVAESALVLDVTDPVGALRALVAFTWEYYVAHPEFIALLSNENLQRGRHVTKSLRVKQLARPVLDILGRILAEGERQQMFRAGLDVQQVYLALASLGYFYLSNRHTLSSFLGRDLMQPAACEAWRDEITRVMLASVTAEAMRQPAAVRPPDARRAAANAAPGADDRAAAPSAGARQNARPTAARPSSARPSTARSTARSAHARPSPRKT